MIYFVEAPVVGLIKIGRTGNLHRRFASLETASPVALRLLASVEGGAEEERALHQFLRESLSHGEWFRADARVLAVVANPELALSALPPVPSTVFTEIGVTLDMSCWKCGKDFQRRSLGYRPHRPACSTACRLDRLRPAH